MIKILLLLCLPAIAGFIPAIFKKWNFRAGKYLIAFAFQIAVCTCSVFLQIGGNASTGILAISQKVSVGFSADAMARFFCLLISFGWLAVLLYSFIYMREEQHEERFLLFMFLSESMMFGVSMASGLVTMYLFFELLTLLSMPLVLHELTEESIRGALKYLFYSIGGAFLALFGVFVFANSSDSLEFVQGGFLVSSSPIILVGTLLTVIGFGAKAGMFPLHGWLPTAHPVAPAPASALLSGLIAKAGVIAIIRILYFTVGPAQLSGTWVQTVLLILSLITVFMGSMMAFVETNLKKRLAYSTVSQISYVLVGLFLLTPDGIQGALLQVLFHAMVKIVLFMIAGMAIFLYHKRDVSELVGIGKLMPVTFGCFLVASLSLIGIPPTGGFLSKWQLAAASLNAEQLGAFTWIIPAVLLLSALLTAGYLLPVGIRAFFPGQNAPSLPRKKKEPFWMVLPILILTASSLLGGVFATPVASWLQQLASNIF